MTAISPAKCGNARASNLCILIWLDTAHSHSTQALVILDDQHSTLKHAVHLTNAQKGDSTLVDHFFADLAFPPSHCSSAGFGQGDLGGQGRCTVKALQPEKTATIVNDGNGGRLFVIKDLCFGGSGDTFEVSEFKN